MVKNLVNKMKGDWRFWKWMLTIAVIGILWVGTVSASVVKVADIENVQTKQEKKITRMDYNIQLIGRAVGVQPLEPSADE
jgi:hypothetical protein